MSPDKVAVGFQMQLIQGQATWSLFSSPSQSALAAAVYCWC